MSGGALGYAGPTVGRKAFVRAFQGWHPGARAAGGPPQALYLTPATSTSMCLLIWKFSQSSI